MDTTGPEKSGANALGNPMGTSREFGVLTWRNREGDRKVTYVAHVGVGSAAWLNALGCVETCAILGRIAQI
jgi:hypothetical protein